MTDGSTTKYTNRTKGKDAKKRLSRRCTRMHTDNKRRRNQHDGSDSSSVIFLPQIFLPYFRPSVIHGSSFSTAEFAEKCRETRRLGVSRGPLRFITCVHNLPVR